VCDKSEDIRRKREIEVRTTTTTTSARIFAEAATIHPILTPRLQCFKCLEGGREKKPP
jgi:hypothetical protein